MAFDQQKFSRGNGNPPESAVDLAYAAHEALKDVDPKALTGATDTLLYALAAGVLSIAAHRIEGDVGKNLYGSTGQ